MSRFPTFKQLTVAALVVCLSACARLQVMPLTPKNHDTEGLRFYAPWPYLLVTQQPAAAPKENPSAPKDAKQSDEKQQAGGAAQAAPPKEAPPPAPTLHAEIIWLPNMDEQYVVRVKGCWGTVDENVQLKDGWMLTSLGAKLDFKGPEAITAFSGFIGAAGGVVKARVAMTGVGAETGGVGPGLYRIEFKNGFVSELIKVELLKDEQGPGKGTTQTQVQPAMP